MKKLFKRKLFWLIVAAVLIIIIIAMALSGGNKQSPYTTEAVTSGNLVQTVSATGSVESADDIDLNFKTAGRLVFLGVDEGDKVEAGKVLARLDAAGLSAQVEQYRASLLSAQADLAKVQAGSSAEDIKVSEEQVAKAQNDLTNLRSERDVQIAALQEKTLDAVNNGIFTSQVALDKILNYFVSPDKIANLQVQDNNLLSSIQSDYYRLMGSWNTSKASADKANSTKNSSDIASAAETLRAFLSDLNGLLNNSFKLSDQIVINGSYSQTTKDSIKTDISTQQSTNNTSLTSLQTAKTNLTNSINSYDSQIQAAENSLNIYQAQLNLKAAGPRDFEVSAAKAKVAQAQAQLNGALANLSDYTITAPIDGTITKVNFSIGEQTSLAEPAIKMLSTEKFEIKVDIPESDVAKIKVGDSAVIELDAFGSDYPFSGKVAFIDPAQTVIQDVIYYRTTVSFDANEKNEQLKSGMTADVTITTAEKNDVLLVPQRAVKVREAVLGEVAEKYVEVLVGENQVEERTVAVGLRGDGGIVEVLTGLSEGDKVVTFKKEEGK